AVFRTKPVSSAAAGFARPPPNRCGQTSTSVRRVTAATPISTRKITALHRRRLVRLDTITSSRDEFPEISFAINYTYCMINQEARQLRIIEPTSLPDGPATGRCGQNPRADTALRAYASACRRFRPIHHGRCRAEGRRLAPDGLLPVRIEVRVTRSPVQRNR